MQGFVFNTAARALPGPPRARGAGLRLRLRVDQREPVLRRSTPAPRATSRTPSWPRRGLPGPAELKILEPFRGKMPEEVFTQAYEPPATDGSGNNRARTCARPCELLKEAGWAVRDGKLRQRRPASRSASRSCWSARLRAHRRCLSAQPEAARHRRHACAPWTPRSTRTGCDDFDFDMMVASCRQSLSPGNEQRDFWGTRRRRTPGQPQPGRHQGPGGGRAGRAGHRAPDRASLVAATRALDRVLLWGHYVIPHWHIAQLPRGLLEQVRLPPEVLAPKYGLTSTPGGSIRRRQRRSAGAAKRAARRGPATGD